MRNELSLLRDMWPAVFLGTALVSGCASVDEASVGPSSTGAPRTVERAVGEGHLSHRVASPPSRPGR